MAEASMSDGFEPRVAAGPFSSGSQKFCFQGLVHPLSAWADACGVDYPRHDALLAHYHLEREGVLPLDAGEIGRACRDAFGEPRPECDRGYPASADWVLTTPMEGVYLTVNLARDAVCRFGWGEEMVETVGRAAFDARQAAMQAAVTETLRTVRAAMAPATTPSP